MGNDAIIKRFYGPRKLEARQVGYATAIYTQGGGLVIVQPTLIRLKDSWKFGDQVGVAHDECPVTIPLPRVPDLGCDTTPEARIWPNLRHLYTCE